MANQTSVPITDSKDVWKRGLFMLLFAIGQAVLNAIAIVQFLWLLFTREPNNPLVRFGNSLSVWLGDVARFQTCATDGETLPLAPLALDRPTFL
jgi:hypothetical protein